MCYVLSNPFLCPLPLWPVSATDPFVINAILAGHVSPLAPQIPCTIPTTPTPQTSEPSPTACSPTLCAPPHASSTPRCLHCPWPAILRRYGISSCPGAPTARCPSNAWASSLDSPELKQVERNEGAGGRRRGHQGRVIPVVRAKPAANPDSKLRVAGPWLKVYGSHLKIPVYG